MVIDCFPEKRVDKALSAMADSSAVLLRECEAEERRMEELEALSEAGIRQHADKRQSSRYDAETVLLTVRLDLAVRCAKAHRDAAREFVCWWLDTSLAAWNSAVHGTPLPLARMGAAALDTLMTDEEMSVLPRADEQMRQLVELGTFLGAPRPDSVSGDNDDLVAMTADLAARAGDCSSSRTTRAVSTWWTVPIRRRDDAASGETSGSNTAFRPCPSRTNSTFSSTAHPARPQTACGAPLRK